MNLSMIYIENFRPIKKLNVEFKPLTVIYGKNGTGKSSLMYAPLVFKQFLLNPNQNLNSIFNFQRINLGDFLQVVHNHDKENKIKVIWEINDEKFLIKYGIFLHSKQSELFLEVFLRDKKLFTEKIGFNFPYQVLVNKLIRMESVQFIWNGFSLIPKQGNTFSLDNTSIDVNEFIKIVNKGVALAKSIDLVPIKRGFFKPLYSGVSVTPNMATEDEVASSLITDSGYIQGKISYYAEKIFDKSFKVFIPLNSSSFYLRVVDKKRHGLETDVINEGFGLNQTLYMLAKILYSNNNFIFIEEPETHLHPSAIDKLVDVFIEIIKTENKQICISTHSEVLVSSLLTKVSQGKIDVNDVIAYFSDNKDSTTLKRQEIKNNGSIEGGLASFMQTELENLKSILNI